MGNQFKSLASLLITKLGNHSMILGRPWMKKHGVLLDIINTSITFSPGYCTYPRVPSFPILTMPTKETEIILIATHQDVFPNQILKRGSAEKIDDFLKTSEKTSKRKR